MTSDDEQQRVQRALEVAVPDEADGLVARDGRAGHVGVDAAEVRHEALRPRPLPDVDGRAGCGAGSARSIRRSAAGAPAAHRRARPAAGSGSSGSVASLSAKSRAICPWSCSSAGPARREVGAGRACRGPRRSWPGRAVPRGWPCRPPPRWRAAGGAAASRAARAARPDRAPAPARRARAPPAARAAAISFDLLRLAVGHQHQDALDLGDRRQGGEGLAAFCRSSSRLEAVASAAKPERPARPGSAPPTRRTPRPWPGA